MLKGALKFNTLSLTVTWKPFTMLKVTIITHIPRAIPHVAMDIIGLEKLLPLVLFSLFAINRSKLKSVYLLSDFQDT